MNQRIISTFLLTLLIFLGSSFSIWAASSNSKVLFVNDSDWPPYFFKGQSNVLPGLGKELLSYCIPKVGYKIDYTYYPLKRMRKYIEQGVIDTNIYSYSKDREVFLFYGKEPWFKSSYRPISLNSSNLLFDSLASFDKLVVGHLAGLRYSPEYYRYIKAREKAGNLIIADSNEALFELLLKGRIDIFVNTKESVTWLAKQQKILDKISIIDFDIKTSDYFFTVSKMSDRVSNQKSLINDMDDCIKTMKSDGAYQEVAAKYGLMLD